MDSNKHFLVVHYFGMWRVIDLFLIVSLFWNAESNRDMAILKRAELGGNVEWTMYGFRL